MAEVSYFSALSANPRQITHQAKRFFLCVYFGLPEQDHPPAHYYQARGIDIMNTVLLLVWHVLYII
jgi:hypothetical protein